MCLLVVCKPNAIPKREDLRNGACANPHGYGFAMIIDGKIFRYRTMSAKKAVNKFISMREQYPQGYAIWHARYATHGVKNEANCHPFQVGDDTDTVLAHNGVLDNFIDKDDKRSDTRVFAEDTLPLIGGVTALDDANVFTMVESWAMGSKIAVLTTNPKALYQMYLINEKSGTWDDNDVWWSNSSYKRTIYDYKPTVRQTDSVANVIAEEEEFWRKQEAYYQLDPELIDMCPMCEALIDLDNSVESCEFCASCLLCYQLPMDCDCYDPNRKAHERGWDFDRHWTLKNDPVLY